MGRAARGLPAIEAAWLAGLGSHHVQVLDRARTRATAAAMAADQEELVGWARTLRFSGFAGVVAYWAQRVDPDGAEGRAQALRDVRRLHLSRSFDGAWFLDGTLDPIAGEIVHGELARLERLLFEAAFVSRFFIVSDDDGRQRWAKPGRPSPGEVAPPGGPGRAGAARRLRRLYRSRLVERLHHDSGVVHAQARPVSSRAVCCSAQ